MSGSADQARRLALVGLSRIVDPGHRGVHQAVQDHGAVEVWEALRRGAVCEPVSPELRAGASLRAEGYDPAADLDRLSRFGARLVCPGDAEWPSARLFWPQEPRLEAPPLALYVHGTHRLGEVVERSVAVVGARAATAYGAYVAGDLSTALCDRGVAVISGGAYGIDAAAHRGALASTRTPTIAVLACGVDVAYPRGHDRLLRQIASTGLVVSELPPGSSPTRGRFLVRNRLIAALSLGTVVVEAALRSGSLATLERARLLSRHVMVVPGPVTSAMSAGCHAQLRHDPPAQCVTRVEEILDTVGAIGDDAAAALRGPVGVRDGLSDTVRLVLDAVPVRTGIGEASIARAAGVSPLVVQQVLPPLHVHGLVERTQDGWRLTALGAGRPAPA
ncbi:MAG: DNA-processing protein DprA [Actinomycetota bacterium]|nr:DNA-processing protein DprA [Actinomycetota bacterium]